MRLAKTLKVLLMSQIVLFIIMMFLEYRAAHDGIDNFNFEIAIPMFLYFILGVINIGLFITHITQAITKKIRFDRLVDILVLIVIGTVLLYDPVYDLAVHGLGAELQIPQH